MIVLPDAWLERWHEKDAFDRVFQLKGEVFREHVGRKTIRFSIDGKYYFAKLHFGIGWREFVKNLFQLRFPVTSAENEWNAIRKLDRIGIHTMHLVGYGKRGWNPARLQSFVITEELENTVSLEDFCRDWPASRPDGMVKKKLIAEVARIARSIHLHGMNHRDFYLCHFLLELSGKKRPVDPENIVLYLIDLHRVQIRRSTPMRWRVKDIAGLYFSSMDAGLSKRDFLRFVRLYEGKALKEAFRENPAFWGRVSKRGVALYRKIFHKAPTLPW